MYLPFCLQVYQIKYSNWMDILEYSGIWYSRWNHQICFKIVNINKKCKIYCWLTLVYRRHFLKHVYRRSWFHPLPDFCYKASDSYGFDTSWYESPFSIDLVPKIPEALHLMSQWCFNDIRPKKKMDFKDFENEPNF